MEASNFANEPPLDKVETFGMNARFAKYDSSDSSDSDDDD